MSSPLHPIAPGKTLKEGWEAIELAFGSLGRALLVLDADLRILRASETLNELVCASATEKALGRKITDLIHSEFFERVDEVEDFLAEEGRQAVMRCLDETSRLVSMTFVPLPESENSKDFPARYLLVLRPAERDNRILQHALSGFGLVARSEAIIKLVRLLSSIHNSDATVLLTGESGVGKEVFARAIHDHSKRMDGPFVVVNCAALPPDLLESELFGHVKGSFTGATADRIGRFEAAGAGTVFLDEIGDMPQPLQVKLLRVLQERTFERVGETTSRPMQARILAATNVDLPVAVKVGNFREDLYYRLRVVPIHIPPLRERLEDIEVLVPYLLSRIAARESRVVRVAPDVIPALKRYPWPGNVRELENALEYAFALSEGTILQMDNFPPEVLDPARGREEVQAHDSLAEPNRPVESEMAKILNALEENHWRRGPAADALGVSRTTLWRKMREHGIDD
jgi:transcriptional regulator with PAS, ATPase and Fis domain